jgi:D-alanyl-D-alanine carboxypeptidase
MRLFKGLSAIEGRGRSERPLMAIQSLLDEFIVTSQISGAAITINYPIEAALYEFTSGYSEVDGEPLSSNHLFQVGSTTKSFIAVLILQLEAEGRLSIEDSIARWILNLKAEWQCITIKQLLNHSSGIYNYTDTIFEDIKQKKFDLNYQWSSTELLDIANNPSYFPPGDNFHYSN